MTLSCPQPGTSEKANLGSLQNGAVLIVDDDETVRGTLNALLSRHYQTYCARSIQEAETILIKHPVRVIVCDQYLDGEEGLPFLERLRSSHPLVQRILITGHTAPSLLLDAINRTSVLRFLVKPASTTELFQAVEAAMQEHAAARQHQVAELDNENLRASLRSILSRSDAPDSPTRVAFQGRLMLMLGFVALTLVTGAAVLLALYYLKSALGIDIFSTLHLQDFL